MMSIQEGGCLDPWIINVPDQAVCRCDEGRYDWVLNFASVKVVPKRERQLILEEVARHGFGTEYNSDDWPISFCLTVAGKACHVTDEELLRALRLGMGLVEGQDGPLEVQCVRFPVGGGLGEFDELYHGLAHHFDDRLEYP